MGNAPLGIQERADRRGRPITNNSDIEIRNLQQEVKDKNKVDLACIANYYRFKVTLNYKSFSI